MSEFSDQQRRVLADKCFTAAVANAERASAPSEDDELYGHTQRAYADAAAIMARTFISLTKDAK